MAIFTRKEITAIEQKPLFRTVDAKGNILTTDGFYIIARKESKISPVIQIDKQDYTDGVGAYNPLFQDGDNVYVYPTNYFGVSCRGGDVELADTLKTQEVIMTKQKEFVASKLPAREK
jgi:hypothetical protein